MSPRRVAVAVALSTVLMSLALALREGTNVWLASGTAGALTLGLGFWGGGAAVRRRLAGRDPDRPAGSRSGPGASLLLGVAAGVLMTAATHVGFGLLDPLLPRLRPLVAGLYADIAATPGPLLALPVVVLVVVAEEVVWRGVLLTALGRRFPPGAALLLATFAYVIPQIVAADPALLLAAFGGGLAWGALFLVRGDLLAPLACHLVWDVGVFVLWPLV